MVAAFACEDPTSARLRSARFPPRPARGPSPAGRCPSRPVASYGLRIFRSQPLVLGGSTLDSRPGGAKGLELASPVRDDELVQVTVRGAAGERAWIVYASQPMAGRSANAYEGELLVGTPRQTVPLGTLPASGTLVVQLAAPTLPPGTEGAVFFSQALVKDAVTGRFVLSSPSALVVLDDSL